MKHFKHKLNAAAFWGQFLITLVLSLGAVLSAPAALVHQWTFNDGSGNDWVGTANGYATNYPGAWNANGQLLLNGINEYFRTTTLSENLTNKTLVVWVTLSNLTQLGGSALTLENPATSDVFDSIGFGATFGAARWFNNSDAYRRTPTNSVSSYPVETSTNEIMFATVFGDGGATNITLYRNGVQYAVYASANTPVIYTNGIADVLLGMRDNNHAADTGGTATGNDAFLCGMVDEARIYDTALTASAIGALYTNGPVAGLPLALGGPGYAWSVNSKSSQSLKTPAVGATNSYTLSAWVYLRSGGSTNLPAGVFVGSPGIFSVQSQTASTNDPQYLLLNQSGFASPVYSTVTVPLRQWVQIGATVDATNKISYYINGAPAGTWAATTNRNLTMESPSIAGTQFNGQIDEVQMWNVVLSAAQLQTNFGRLLVTPQTGLLFYYQFDQQSTKDSSGNGNNGTFSGGFTFPYSLVFAPSGAQPFSPAISASALSATSTSASFSGMVNPEGTNTSAWFEWGATTNFGNLTPVISLGSNTIVTNFTQTVNGLTQGIPYYAALIASNGLGSITSAVITFSALGPVLFPPSVSAIYGTNATFNGTVNPNGIATLAWFQYGPTTSYGSLTAATNLVAGTNFNAFSALATNLIANSSYHMQLVASNANGKVTSVDVPFLSYPSPIVTTVAASVLTPTTATLNGTVNPEGSTGQGWFQWGSNTNYGNTTAPAVLGSGGSTVIISNSLTALSAGFTYHFRAVGSNFVGIFYGQDQSFSVVTNLQDNAPGSLRQLLTQTGSNGVIGIFMTGTNFLTAGELLIGSNITIIGPGPLQLSISGGDHYSVFEIANNANAAISGLTIRDGFNNNNACNGGGLLVDSGGTLALSNCIVTSNSTGINGVNGGNGGGLYSAGKAILTACTFVYNQTASGITASTQAGGSLGGNGGSGGGIYNTGTLIISGSTISSNACGNGSAGEEGDSGEGFDLDINGGTGGSGGAGGAIFTSGTAAVTACALVSNTTGSGAIGGENGQDDEGNIGVDGNSGNGGHGGGVVNFSGSLNMTNCTLANNACGVGANGTTGDPADGNGGNGGSGGAVCLVTGAINLTACTLVQNSVFNGGTADPTASAGQSGNGGGIANLTGNVSSASLRSSIVALNTITVGGGVNLYSVFTSQGYNFIGQMGDSTAQNSGSVGFINGQNGDLVGTPSAPIDPLITSATNNGGATFTCALQPNSPALDGGDDLLAPILVTDQRGQIRLAGAHVDIGAYELNGIGFPPPVIASPVSGVVTNNLTNGLSSIQFSATLDAGGFATTAVLQFGITTNYGNALAPISIGFSTNNTPFSLLLSGLPPGITYHYRLVLSNLAGTTYGPDQTFVTTIAGDLNGDGVVDLNELNQIIQNYRSSRH